MAEISIYDKFLNGTGVRALCAEVKSLMQSMLQVLSDAIDTRIPASEKAAADGVATLDSGGKVPAGQLPAATETTAGAVKAGRTPMGISLKEEYRAVKQYRQQDLSDSSLPNGVLVSEYPLLATARAEGLMSGADKAKLDALPTAARLSADNATAMRTNAANATTAAFRIDITAGGRWNYAHKIVFPPHMDSATVGQTDSNGNEIVLASDTAHTELLKWLCATYPGLTYATFRGIHGLHGDYARYDITIYDTSDLVSGLPRRAFGTEQVLGTSAKFHLINVWEGTYSAREL